MFQRFIACSWCEALSTGSSHKPCCYTWFVCHDISQHNVLLAQARPTMVKHLCLQQWCALNRIIFFLPVVACLLRLLATQSSAALTTVSSEKPRNAVTLSDTHGRSSSSSFFDSMFTSQRQHDVNTTVRKPKRIRRPCCGHSGSNLSAELLRKIKQNLVPCSKQ